MSDQPRPPSGSPPSIRSPIEPAPPRRSPPDRGSSRAGRIAWLVAIPLIFVVMALQQTPYIFPADPPPPTAEVEPRQDMLLYFSRVLVRASYAMEDDPGTDPRVGQQITGELAPFVVSETDQLRSITIAGDLMGDEDALARLETFIAETGDRLNTESLSEEETQRLGTLLEDARIFRSLFRNEVLTPEAEQLLIEHHGWFARLALTKDQPRSDPERRRALGSRTGIRFFMGICVLGALGGFICTLVFSILAIVALASGWIRLAFRPPLRGGTVYLEIVAIFLAAFVLLQAAVVGTAHAFGEEAAVIARLTLPWAFLLIPLWPMARGVAWRELRVGLGLHAPQGVLREVGAGIAAYFATLPITALAIAITVVIAIFKALFDQLASGDDAIAPPDNPIVDIIGTAGTLELIMFFLLASVWAPLVEETIFRGAFFRHLRSRASFIPAAALTALVFGVMHSYFLFFLLPVITLGFIFGLIREWRGSLIGCITAHALHNGTIMSLLMAVKALFL